MCGRFTLTASGQVLADAFELADVPALEARYNIAPSQDVAAIVLEAGARTLRAMRWGLIPFWAKDPALGNRMINARSEGVTERPAFREAFRARRCLLPATGFFEWKRVGAAKQPMLLRRRDGRPFAFAGLWDRWRPPEGETIESCTILTTEPNDLVASIHDRMPVILPAEVYSAWLDPSFDDRESLLGRLGPYPASEMIAHAVSRRVNNPAHDDPECVEPVEDGSGGLFD